MTAKTKSELSEPRRRLLTLMQQKVFGRIEYLVVRDRQPVLDPLPRVVRERRFAMKHPGPGPVPQDFVLKAQVHELFELFDQLGEGVIELLEFRDGLPYRVNLCEPA